MVGLQSEIAANGGGSGGVGGEGGGGDGGGNGGDGGNCGAGGGEGGGGDGGGEGVGMMHRTSCVNPLSMMLHSPPVPVVAVATGFPLHVSGVNMSSVMHRPLSLLQQEAS